MEYSILKQALSKLKLAIDNKGITEYSKALCFRNGKAMAFDGTCGVVIKLGLDFQCCVNGEDFISQVAKLDQDIDLEFKGATLHLKSGNFKAKFKTFPEVEFPNFIPQDRSELIREDPTLFPALKALAPYMGYENNPLGGMCLVQDRVYACNGKTATRATLTKQISHMVHIPANSVDVILKFGDPVMLFRAHDLVGAYYPDESVITNQIVARFPWEQVDTAFTVEGPEVELPEDIKGVLKRITPSVDDAGDATLSGTQTHLRIATDSAQEDMEWQGVPEEWTCRVNLKRFGEAIKGTRKVKLGNVIDGGNGSSLLFVGDNYLHAMGLPQE